MPELGLTRVEVGWLFTAFLFTYMVFQVPGALVGQWLGARRVLRYAHLALEYLSQVARRIERAWEVVDGNSTISLR